MTKETDNPLVLNVTGSNSKSLNSQMNKRELEMQNQIKELRNFAHVIAHDLRSPISTAYNFQNYIEDKLKNGEFDENEDFDMVSVIGRKLTDALNLIDDMLNYAESGGKVDLDESCSIHDVISLALSNLSTSINKANALVSIHVDQFRLKGSLSLLSSIIMNIVSNSIKYCKVDTPPVVDIQAKIKDECAQIIIYDEGRGIPEGDIDKIFNEFIRVKKYNSVSGSGIGLATVKKIIKAHQGEISIKSIENEFTEVCITLPILK